MTTRYIFGAGGHGKVVLDAMHSQVLVCDAFVDDKPIKQWAGLQVILDEDRLPDSKIHIAIGNSTIRERIAASHDHTAFFSVHHAAANVSPSAQLSQEGIFLAANCVIAADASVGSHSIINHGAVVDHDCTVGNFCHIAPNASLGGGATIGDHVLVGAGAVVLPGVTIKDHVIIGAGAVVTKDIQSAGVFVGAPATRIK